MDGSRAGTFDYVVVGSGAGGATLAARLAESGARVLMLEAGRDPSVPSPGLPDQYDVPAFHALATENPALAWNFYVRDFGDDSGRRRAFNGSRPPGVLYPRASTLGGCTAHNAMLLLATPDKDWDRIAEQTQDPSWRASEMRRHFQAIDDCRYRPVSRFLAALSGGLLNASGHGWNGWLPSELARSHQALEDHALVRAIREAIHTDMFDGHGPLPAVRQAVARVVRFVLGEADPNDQRTQGRVAEGFCETPLTTCRGQRRGARERALAAMHRAGLVVEFDALATRIILDKGRAVGVEYLKGADLYRASPRASENAGEQRTVYARRETILCGGAFNTPQLLMLSGIGPPEQIERVGLQVARALPGVGANLQDRYEISLVHRVKKPWRCLEGARFEPGDPIYEAWRDGRGMYRSNGAAMAFRWFSRDALPEPDLFAMGLLTRFDGYYPGYSEVIRQSRADFSFALLKAYTGNHRGRVSLGSADPRDPPVIDFQYFAAGADDDLAALVNGIRRLRRITGSLVDREVLEPEDTPGADTASDEAIADFIRRRAWGHHASCSCAIGFEDNGGVLDSDFRVHGIQGLRVADASVFPDIPGYFIVSAVYTIAEKAAAAILKS